MSKWKLYKSFSGLLEIGGHVYLVSFRANRWTWELEIVEDIDDVERSILNSEFFESVSIEFGTSDEHEVLDPPYTVRGPARLKVIGSEIIIYGILKDLREDKEKEFYN